MHNNDAGKYYIDLLVTLQDLSLCQTIPFQYETEIETDRQTEREGGGAFLNRMTEREGAF